MSCPHYGVVQHRHIAQLKFALKNTNSLQFFALRLIWSIFTNYGPWYRVQQAFKTEQLKANKSLHRPIHVSWTCACNCMYILPVSWFDIKMKSLTITSQTGSKRIQSNLSFFVDCLHYHDEQYKGKVGRYPSLECYFVPKQNNNKL